MAKSTLIKNPAFNKTESAPKPGFNLAPQTNSFNSIFETPQLDEKTSDSIDRIMLEIASPDQSEEEIRQDTAQLKMIACEVKAIEKQGVLLIGERLFKARAIFGRYERGKESFTSWLNLVFKNPSSAWNVLSYYELYKSLPTRDLQSKLKEMPHRAAYMLASRKGDLNKKSEIIEKYAELRADEIISILQEVFPSAMRKEMKQNTANTLIKVIRINLKKLIAKKQNLAKNDFLAIRECKSLITALLEGKTLDTSATENE